jgi:uncharacterized repeat protein (TIGR01451 family)
MKRRYLLPIALVLAFLLGFAPTQAQGTLNVYLAASSDAVGAGDAIDYTLMVSNTGSTALNNVYVEVQLPQQINWFPSGAVIGDFACSGGYCYPNETEAWNVGTLAPGENRHIIYPTYIANDQPAGEATTIVVASADNTSDIIMMHDVAVDPSPLLRLSLVPDPGPAAPSEPFTYTLTYGNVGTSSPEEVVLAMPVPDGTSFQSATGGGAEAGGVVTWALGTVGVGAGGRVEMTVVPDAGLMDGATLEAEAMVDPGVATELVVRSEAVTEVGPRQDLRFDYSLSQNAMGRSGFFTYTLTATNTSTTNDITGASVRFRLPHGIDWFATGDVVGDLACSGGYCYGFETEAWNIGTLAPGQSRTVILPNRVSNDTQQGEVLRGFYRAVADGLEEQTGGTDLVVDPSPVISLSLVPGPGPAVPGEAFTYTLLFSNIGFQPTDLALRMALPEGTTFVSATGGGAESGGVVTWQAPSVAIEAVGRIAVVVAVNPGLPIGTILRAEAALDSGSDTEYAVYSAAATPVRADTPLEVTYTADLGVGSPGDPLDFTMVAQNNGSADLTDVVVEFRLPRQINWFATGAVVGDFACSGGYCYPNETEAWNVGTLAPGQSRTILMPTSIASDADEGSFLLSPVVAKATGSNEVVLHLDVLLGDQVFVSNEPSGDAAESFALGIEAYPSPFAGAATFALSLPEQSDVRLVVYDVLGRTVGTVVQEPFAAGEHEVTWDARGLPGGVYFYRLDTTEGARTGSLVKVR